MISVCAFTVVHFNIPKQTEATKNNFFIYVNFNLYKYNCCIYKQKLTLKKNYRFNNLKNLKNSGIFD